MYRISMRRTPMRRTEGVRKLLHSSYAVTGRIEKKEVRVVDGPTKRRMKCATNLVSRCMKSTTDKTQECQQKNMFEAVQFETDAFEKWSNLLLWTESELHPTKIPLSDGRVRVEMIRKNAYLVSCATEWNSDYNMCGEYITSSCRLVKDPVEFASLVCTSPSGYLLSPVAVYGFFTHEHRISAALRIFATG
jgi:hypothetical protein